MSICLQWSIELKRKNWTRMNLIDLPNKILLVVFEKLKTVDVLYSLLGVNQRFDQIVLNLAIFHNVNLVKSMDMNSFYDCNYSIDEKIILIKVNQPDVRSYRTRWFNRILQNSWWPNRIGFRSDPILGFIDLGTTNERETKWMCGIFISKLDFLNFLLLRFRFMPFDILRFSRKKGAICQTWSREKNWIWHFFHHCKHNNLTS